MSETLEQRVARHEQYRGYAYRDINGFWTYGYGHCIDEREGGACNDGNHGDFYITQQDAWALMEQDIDKAHDGMISQLPWASNLSEARQEALTEMAYWMGVDGLMKFQVFLPMMQSGRFSEAAKDLMENTQIGKEFPQRTKEIACLIAIG